MNWDLLIGLIAGLSASIIGLIGNIITTRQNHAHELKVSVQRIALENSFKEYELKNNLAKEISSQTGQGYIIYPYDMYLLTYAKIAEHMNKEKTTPEDLIVLLAEMESIKETYESIARTENV